MIILKICKRLKDKKTILEGGDAHRTVALRNTLPLKQLLGKVVRQYLVLRHFQRQVWCIVKIR